MSNEFPKANSAAPEDWGIARPEKPPRSTLWPAAVAFGVTLMAWGIISSLLVTVFGLAVFAVAMTGWIKEIRHERKS